MSEKKVEQPQDKWKNEVTNRRLSGKRQNQKAMEVFMDLSVRDGIKALAVIENMTAQDYVERLLINEVTEKKNLVDEGLRILQQTEGNTTRARFQLQEEKISRLQNALEAATRPSSHR